MIPNNEILIDYLDNQLNTEEAVQVENMVKNDTQVASELLYLKLALDTVRLDAVNEKVSAVRQSFHKAENDSKKSAPAIVRSMYKTTMRIAAILVLFAGIAILYKYISVNNLAFYNKQFTGYELTNTRGQEAHNSEANAYQNKNWNGVITLYNAENNKSNKSIFLAAMAEMQLYHFPQAVSLFENILNAKTGDNSFREEAEYYVSLAYLMNHEESKSILMLGKIKADTGHTYYPLVSKMSPIDLKIIELKK